MKRPPRCIATDALTLLAQLFVCLALLGQGGLVYAASIAGTVTHLSGPLLAKKADGAVKVLSVKSSVESGDTLVTEKDTYARVKFIDNSEITLRPGSQLKIDSFVFDEQKQENDNAFFSLVKGGLRAVTGALGKRSKERFGMNTPTATIGIRGTIFVAEYVPPDAAAVASYLNASVAAAGDAIGPLEPLRLAQSGLGAPGGGAIGGRAPGLYVQVLDGMIHLTNNGGTQNFAAGQFGFAPSLLAPPVILPNNPGIQFAPPPAFNTSSAGGQNSTASNGQGNNVDCEVR
ncbi:MAG TPA: FecR domain-containing protein [Paucimonas sp.]|nr:FecR domain-containing protein [Paucimonas sp.]